MPGTCLESVVSTTLKIRETDLEGLALSASCVGTPPTTAGVFAHGCIMLQTDTSTGAKGLYENVGSSAVPSWNLLGDIAASEITLATGSVLVGTAGVAAALDAKGSGKILVGNGTTVASVSVSGDVTLAANGATTVTDLTIASEARGDLLRRGASTWEHFSAKTAGQILVGDGTDVVSVPVSGDATLSAAGVLTVTSAFSSVTYDLTPANIIGMFAAPVVIVAGQAGKTIEFLGATVVYDYDTATYGGGGAVGVVEETSGTALSGTIAAAESFGAAGDKLAEIKPVATTIAPTAGKGLCITNADGAFTNPGTAAGVGRLHVRYRVVTTGL